MLKIAVFAILGAVAGAASCSTNATNTGCKSPSISECVETCSLYKSQSSCGSMTGCRWATSNMFGIDTSTCTAEASHECASKTNDTCTGSCTWTTTPCAFEYYCSGGTTTSTTTNASCMSQCSDCTWRARCEESDVCEIAGQSQAACTGVPGCFWSTGSSSIEGTSSSCGLCFNDPSKNENQYLFAKSHIGQTCSINVFFASVSFTLQSAIPSATGCDGGVAAPVPAAMTCGASTLSLASSLVLTLFALCSA